VARVGKDAGGRREGTVVRVEERAHKTLTGRLEVEGRRAYVVPEERRIFRPILLPPRGGRGGARAGEMVEVSIERYPGPRSPAEGRVVQVFGYPEDPEAELGRVIAKYQLPAKFSRRCLEEAERVARPISAEELAGREDFRKHLTFTIDGEDARDFDDAVSLETLPGGGVRLGVHIADVSHYVREGGPLDAEALERGNSVYFPDRAIPMFPPSLSSGVCCLKEGEERLTLSAFLDFGEGGRRVARRLTPSVIRSRARLTYTIAGAVIEGRERGVPGALALAGEVKETLRAMDRLAQALRARRMEEGSLDFELPEAHVLLDAKGDPLSVTRAPRNRAHHLIEEFMLAANRAVAEILADSAPAALYRVHEPPEEQELELARIAIHNLSLPIPLPPLGLSLRPKALQGALEATRGGPVETFVHLLLLRCMKQARYSPENLGHYGLGFEAYTHFTSPIRRYPDLVVHRLLKAGWGARGEAPGRPRALAERLAQVAEHCSERERLAESAEREVVDFQRARFMKAKVGECFAGHISGVARFGLFVELDEVYVEGLLRVERLADDYYLFRENLHSLLGRRTGRRYRLGDPIRVQVIGVDLANREVELAVAP
ncbi:MAG: ribonuclease R, partial [Nitrospinota bacterium]